MSYYVTNENSFLDIKNAHLRVTGNVHTDVLKVGSIGFQPVGSNISGTVNFTNVTTGVTTSSNLDVGGTLNLGTIELSASTHTLDHITARGNVTSTTVQFDNDTTGLVTTANVEVGGDLTVSGGVVSNVNLLSVSNVASIKKDSNVVTEFPRSKKLIKYPRVAMTGPSAPTGYVASASDESSGNSAWEAFDNNADGATASHRWRTNSDRYTDNSSTGIPSSPTGAAASTYLFSGSEAGDWISVEFPEKMKLNYYTITGIHYHTPYEGVIYGYNTTTTTWERVSSFINRTVNDGTNNPVYSPEFQVDEGNTNYYSKYAMIVVKTNGHHAPSMYEWKLYGTPEYDPEADGVDVVVKSVPNVPNTDWLEVYYDAKNYSGSGDVQDESGNDRDAEMNATFDNGEIKAFNFSGAYTSNVTTSDHGLGTGDVTYTMSYWFKRTAVASTYDYLVILGTGGTSYSSSLMWINNNQLTLDHWGSALRVLEPIVLDKWYHVVAGHRGGDTPSLENDFIYINGTRVTPQITQTAAPFTLAGSKLTLGTSHYLTTEYFNGSIANFRLFNRALTPDEIWQLYAYQKEYFGHGDLGMTLKAGRLGIGTSEPRAMLDVRGDLYAPGTIVQVEQSLKIDTFSTTGASNHPVSPGNDVPGLAVTIHPKFANSKILVSYTVSTGAYGRAYLRIQRKQGGSTTTIAPSVGVPNSTDGRCTTSHSGSGESSVDSQSFEYYDTIGGTEPITYQIQAWTYHSVYYIYVNRGHADGNGSNDGTYWARTLSSITAKEVCQ